MVISHTLDCPLASCPYPHRFSHHPWLACSLCPADFVPADPPGPTDVDQLVDAGDVQTVPLPFPTPI